MLAATRDAVERHGYTATTVDQIAAAAGVSKGSIYRRWPTKGVLVYDACIASPDVLGEVIDSGDIRADLLAIARITAGGYSTRRHRRRPQVLAEAANDPALREMLRTRFFEPRSDAIVRRVELAIERGEAPPGSTRSWCRPCSTAPSSTSGACGLARPRRGRARASWST